MLLNVFHVVLLEIILQGTFLYISPYLHFLINPLRKILKVDFFRSKVMIHVGGGAGNKLCFKSIDEL